MFEERRALLIENVPFTMFNHISLERWQIVHTTVFDISTNEDEIKLASDS